METVGEWVVDGLDFWIVNQAVVVTIDAHIGGKVIEFSGTLRVAAGYSYQSSVVGGNDGRGCTLDADIGSTDYTPTYRCALRSYAGLHTLCSSFILHL